MAKLKQNGSNGQAKVEEERNGKKPQDHRAILTDHEIRLNMMHMISMDKSQDENLMKQKVGF